MSLVPAFEIDIWNAWIFMIFYILAIPLLGIVSIDVTKRMQTPTSLTSNKTRQKISQYWIIAHLLFLYSIFLPLKLGTTWLYIGLPIYLLGLIPYIIAIVNVGTTPLDKPFTKGMYRYSRHPMYVTAFIFFLGVSIATASWVFLLFTILLIAASFYFAPLEEQSCLEKYGDAYREYMNRTPRYIGIPKSEGK